MSNLINWRMARLSLAPLLLLTACGGEPEDTTLSRQGNMPATATTIEANAKVPQTLDLADPRDCLLYTSPSPRD